MKFSLIIPSICHFLVTENDLLFLSDQFYSIVWKKKMLNLFKALLRKLLLENVIFLQLLFSCTCNKI